MKKMIYHLFVSFLCTIGLSTVIIVNSVNRAVYYSDTTAWEVSTISTIILVMLLAYHLWKANVEMRDKDESSKKDNLIKGK